MTDEELKRCFDKLTEEVRGLIRGDPIENSEERRKEYESLKDYFTGKTKELK